MSPERDQTHVESFQSTPTALILIQVTNALEFDVSTNGRLAGVSKLWHGARVVERVQSRAAHIHLCSCSCKTDIAEQRAPERHQRFFELAGAGFAFCGQVQRASAAVAGVRRSFGVMRGRVTTRPSVTATVE